MKYIFLILTIFSATAAAQNRLASEAEGYSFAVPRGWQSEASADGFAVANPAKTVVVAVKGHSYANFQAFAAEANLERDGLKLVGEAKAFEGGNYFRTTNGKI